MLLDSVKNLFGRQSPPSSWTPRPAKALSQPALLPLKALLADDDTVWPSARVGVAEALWGEGFLSPGGEAEILRFAKPLGLSEAASLLLLGAASGGPLRCLVTELGVWVTAFEANARLVELANERCARAGLGRRAQVKAWDTHAPKFPSHYFHHGLALESLRDAAPEPTLSAVAQALKPGGQLVMVETVADLPLDPADRMVANWARLEHRDTDVPGELAITRVLGQLGFDVRIAEDITRRHLHQAIDGWRDAVQRLRDEKPTLRQTALLVSEAELWVRRFKLMRAGKLRVVRWHAISR